MGNYTKILKEICEELKIEIQSFSDNWAFRLEKDSRVRCIYGYNFGLDEGSIQQFCNDKSMMSDLLEFYHIPHVEHFFMMNVKDYNKSGKQLLKKYRKVVCKANDGKGGKQVFLVENEDEMDKAAIEIFEKGSRLAISPYIEIEKEYRSIVLDGEIKLLFSKERPFLIGDGVHTIRELLGENERKVSEITLLDVIPKNQEKVLLNWKHNLGQGAVPIIEPYVEQVEEIVKEVLQKVGIRFASVDVVKCGENYSVLEINSGVTLEHFSKADKGNYEIAKQIYKEAICKLFD